MTDEVKYYCEECSADLEGLDLDLCQTCYENRYCECGRELEEGSEGPDFCIKCR